MEVLKTIRKGIANEYRACIGADLRDWTFTDGDMPTSTAVWVYVDPTNLTEAPQTLSNCGGLIVDDEIGVVLFVIPFSPGTSCDAVINRALQLQSNLLPESNYTSAEVGDQQVDPRGAWTISILWVVSEEHREEWARQIVERRHNSGFAEELSNDIFEYTEKTLALRVRDHHFPQLLLQTRAALRRDKDETDAWLNVDNDIARALEGFCESFVDEDERAIADQVVSKFEELRVRGRMDVQPQGPTRPVSHIDLKNVRGIRTLNLAFGLPSEKPRAHAVVINGPNGSGKSTIFEAVSIALSGTSHKHILFSKDKDVHQKEKDYVAYALSPLGAMVGKPEVRINGGDNALGSVATDDLSLRYATFDGTLLSQADSVSFAQLNSEELGARVLSGYSNTSGQLREFLASGYERTNNEWQGLLRNFGIRASVTRRETYIEKICASRLSRELPGIYRPLEAALQQVSWFQGKAGREAEALLSRWTAVAGETAISELSARVAKAAALGDMQTVTGEIDSSLTQRRAITEALRSWSDETRSRLRHLFVEYPDVAKDVRAWGAWMSRASRPAGVNDNEVARLKNEAEKVAKEQQVVLEQGRDVRAVLDHLTAISTLVADWSVRHPNDCPTCGVDHSQAGGINVVLAARSADLATKREQLAQEFKRMGDRAAEIRSKLETLGESECPLSMERRAELTKLFESLVSDAMPFETEVLRTGKADEFLSHLIVYEHFPEISSAIAPIVSANELCVNLFKEIEAADARRAEPQRWSNVKSALDKRLGQIVEQHLPRTIERLWMELVSYLTAARWVLPEKPRFKSEDQRGQQLLTLRVPSGDRTPLARYVLNQSEEHILGLAWFVVRFATHGRHICSSMILDDPAQEMDQPTFRGFCRLLAKILRLERINNRPLALVVMLHQEERALDLTRDTNASLVVLGWKRIQSDAAQSSIRTIRLLSDSYGPIRGQALFRTPSRAAAG